MSSSFCCMPVEHHTIEAVYPACTYIHFLSEIYNVNVKKNSSVINMYRIDQNEWWVSWLYIWILKLYRIHKTGLTASGQQGFSKLSTGICFSLSYIYNWNWAYFWLNKSTILVDKKNFSYAGWNINKYIFIQAKLSWAKPRKVLFDWGFI